MRIRFTRRNTSSSPLGGPAEGERLSFRHRYRCRYDSFDELACDEQHAEGCEKRRRRDADHPPAAPHPADEPEGAGEPEAEEEEGETESKREGGK
jgi:hypothetical protein